MSSSASDLVSSCTIAEWCSCCARLRAVVYQYLVMLDPLRGADQREVGRGIVLLLDFFHYLLAVLDDPHHALARLRARPDISLQLAKRD